MKYILSGLLLCLAALMASTSYAATISASVDRSLINAGETVQLTLDIKGSPDDDPDFRELEKDFDVLSRNQSSSMQIINGSVSSQKQWVLTLMPKAEGVLTIPSIPFGKDRSNAVVITVKTAQVSRPGVSAEDIFLQVKAEPKEAPVQAQVIYTVRVYIATNVSNASLSEPKLSDADAVVKKLGEDRRFNTTYLGRPYQVVERRYAIFPQQSGKLTITPVTFDAQVAVDSGYGMNIFRRYGQARRLRSESVDINILPIPTNQKAQNWLPASELTLQDAWTQDPKRFKVGEAITHTVTLTATGLTAAQLPEIIKSAPDGFKTYPDQASLDDQIADTGITGVREEKIAMIATRPGDYTIPAIHLKWWNTKTKQQQTAIIPARKITVVAAPGSTTPSVTLPVTPAPVIKSTPAPAPVEKTQVTAQIKPTSQDTFWPWLSTFLGTGWLLTLLIVAYRSTGKRKVTSATAPVKEDNVASSRKVSEKKLRQACETNNAEVAKVALLEWGNSLFPEKGLTSIGELAGYLEGVVAEQIIALNQVLYSNAVQDWHGQALWESIQGYTKKQQKKTLAKESLAPLYP